MQGAGARVAFALARDGALPLSRQDQAISPRHRTPANAILVGTIVPFLFLLLVLVNPSKPVHVLWFDYPANVNALYALVSFATSGIYLAFLLTVVGALVARAARLEAERRLHARRVGRAGDDRRRALPAAHAARHRLAQPALERPGRLQLRLGHASGHGADRRSRRALRSAARPDRRRRSTE